MTEEEELAERIAEEERNLKREKWVNFFIRAITIIIIGLVLMVIIENILDYREKKAIADAAAEVERIAVKEEIAYNASIAAAEAARLVEIAAKKRREELEDKCGDIFDDSLDNYHKYFFDTKEEALEWITEENKIRTDRNKTFAERVNYQIRYAVMFAKLNQVSLPFMIGVGYINSNNINESQGLVCVSDGLITLGKGGTDNLLYQITMRREWM